MSSFYSKGGCCNDCGVVDARFQRDWICFLYLLQISMEDIPQHITLSSLQGFMEKFSQIVIPGITISFSSCGHCNKVIRYCLNISSFLALADRKPQPKFGIHFCYTFQVMYLSKKFILASSIFPILFIFLHFVSNCFVVLLHAFYKLF